MIAERGGRAVGSRPGVDVREGLRRSARSIVVALALAGLVVGCDRLPGRPVASERPVRPSEVRDFALLYGDNCAGCHGATGRLGGAFALDNPVYLAVADDRALHAVIAGGVAGTGMPAFAHSQGGTLTDEQIDIVVAGMRARWGKPVDLAGAPPPPYAARGAADPARGAAVAATYCAPCHGANGQGGSHGGSIVDPAYLALVSDQGLRSIVIAGRPDFGMPDFRADGKLPPLTAGQVTDLVGWLRAAGDRPPKG